MYCIYTSTIQPKDPNTLLLAMELSLEVKNASEVVGAKKTAGVA